MVRLFFASSYQCGRPALLSKLLKKIATPNASAVYCILMFVFLVRSPWLAPTGGDLREKGLCGWGGHVLCFCVLNGLWVSWNWAKWQTVGNPWHWTKSRKVWEGEWMCFCLNLATWRSDAEQSHAGWHARLLQAGSSSGRVGCRKTRWWLYQMALGRFMSRFQV